MNTLFRFFFPLLVAAAPMMASAHVKWFAEEPASVSWHHWDQSLLWLGIGVLLVARLIAGILELQLPDVSKEWKTKMKRLYPSVLTIFRILVGLWLVLTAYNGGIFAPNIPVHGGFGQALQIAEALVGIWIMTGVGVHAAAVALVVVYVAVIPFAGLPAWLDHIDVLGIAAFLGIEHAQNQPWYKKAQPWALPLLRVLTGAGLIVLGFSEKLIDPTMALQFLSEHNWNFMQAIGIEWFTNDYFVFAAGLSEVLFGVLLISGVITRITTIALSLFFVSTLFLLGPAELIGHLPFFGIALVLILYGSGDRLKQKIKRNAKA